MVVIVASLFLPFQPQFEIDASHADTAALIESQPVKIPSSTAAGYSGLDSSEILRKTRTSSVHSNSPLLGPDKRLGAPDLSEQPRDGDGALKSTNNTDISSELFMENLTANAQNTGVGGTPVNPVHHHGNTSVEEFFSSHPGGMPHANIGQSGRSSRNYSISSTPGAEAIFSPVPTYDSTANLLKNVNKSLYQNMVSGNGSPVQTAAFEGNTPPQASQPTGTVITPKSRDLPDLNSSVVDLPKAKQQQQQQYSLPSMRRVHRKSSNASPANAAEAREVKSPLSSKAPIRAHESGRHALVSSALKNEVIEESDSDNFLSDNEENERSSVPQFLSLIHI